MTGKLGRNPFDKKPGPPPVVLPTSSRRTRIRAVEAATHTATALLAVGVLVFRKLRRPASR